MPAHQKPIHSAKLPNLSGARIDQNRIQLLDIIGAGTFGIVYRAVDLTIQSRHPVYYAVKCQAEIKEKRYLRYQQREIKLHTLASSLSSPGVVRLHRVVKHSGMIFLILDYCEDGDLFNLLTADNPFVDNDALIKHVFVQVLDAVQLLHSHGIYHRDLKPENILCRDQGRDIMLTDFGLATSDETSGEFRCGSVHYMSPECLGDLFGRSGTYAHPPSDVWALGVILVNLVCARLPWTKASNIDSSFRAFLHDPEHLQRTLPISTQTNEILKRVFTVDAGARVTIRDLRTAILRVHRFGLSEHEVARVARVRPELWAIVQSLRARKCPVTVSVHSEDIVGHRGALDDVFIDDSPFGDHARGEHSNPGELANVRVLQTQSYDPYVAAGYRSAVHWHATQCPASPDFSAASMSSAASSAGPVTPQMAAFDDAAIERDLEDDALDMGEAWQPKPPKPAQAPRSSNPVGKPQPNKTNKPVKRKESKSFFQAAIRKMKVFNKSY